MSTTSSIICEAQKLLEDYDLESNAALMKVQEKFGEIEVCMEKIRSQYLNIEKNGFNTDNNVINNIKKDINTMTVEVLQSLSSSSSSKKVKIIQEKYFEIADKYRSEIRSLTKLEKSEPINIDRDFRKQKNEGKKDIKIFVSDKKAKQSNNEKFIIYEEDNNNNNKGNLDKEIKTSEVKLVDIQKSTLSKPDKLSDLLYSKTKEGKGANLRSGLEGFKLLLTIALRAVDALETKEFDKFDPLVGETACQIRAVRIAKFANDVEKMKGLGELKGTIERNIKSIESLLQEKSIRSLMKSKSTLGSVLNNEWLDLNLDSEEFCVIQSFLLTLEKKKRGQKSDNPLIFSEYNNPKELQKFGKASNSFCNDLDRKTRQLLSASSVAFVQEHAQKLEDKKIIEMCSDKYAIKFQDAWPTIPMFWTYRALLLSAVRDKIPVIFLTKFLAKDKDEEILREEAIYFQPIKSKKGWEYEAAIPSKEDLKKTGIFVQGVTRANTDQLPTNDEWKNTVALLKMEVVYMGAADHRQYPDESADAKIDELKDSELEMYRVRARKEGYALKSTGMFFIQHVYPDTVGKLEILKNQKMNAEKSLQENSDESLLEVSITEGSNGDNNKLENLKS